MRLVRAVILLVVMAIGTAALSAWAATPSSPSETAATAFPVSDNESAASKAAKNSQDGGDGDQKDGRQVYLTSHTPYEFHLTQLAVGILAAALLALVAVAWKLLLTPEFTRTFVIIVIIFAALFLIVAGYSDEQAAPVYGLLGTIAGYIFGRTPRDDEPSRRIEATDKSKAEQDGATDKKQEVAT